MARKSARRNFYPIVWHSRSIVYLDLKVSSSKRSVVKAEEQIKFAGAQAELGTTVLNYCATVYSKKQQSIYPILDRSFVRSGPLNKFGGPQPSYHGLSITIMSQFNQYYSINLK